MFCSFYINYSTHKKEWVYPVHITSKHHKGIPIIKTGDLVEIASECCLVFTTTMTLLNHMLHCLYNVM